MSLFENVTTLWRHSTERLDLSRTQVVRFAFLAGAIAGLAALIFYRAFLPWWLRERRLTEIPGMVGKVMADTENPQVFCGIMAGACGGALISFASSTVWPAGNKGLLISATAFLIGGLILAVAQEIIGGQGFHSYWPEFLAYGGAATLTCIRLVRFPTLRGMSDVMLLTLVPSIVGAIAFGAVNVLLGQLPIDRGSHPHGFEGWLVATVFTCPLYLSTLSGLTYLFARAKADPERHQ